MGQPWIDRPGGGAFCCFPAGVFVVAVMAPTVPMSRVPTVLPNPSLFREARRAAQNSAGQRARTETQNLRAEVERGNMGNRP